MLLTKIHNGVVIGWISYEIKDHVMNIYTLQVAAAWRRKGVGTELVKRALGARGYCKAVAHVMGGDDNIECIGLFEKMGFHRDLVGGEVYMKLHKELGYGERY